MLTITILRPVATTFVYHYCFGFLFPSFLGTFSANSHLLILDAANFLAGMVVDFLAVNAVLVVGVVLVVGAVLVVEQLAEEVVEYLADSDTAVEDIHMDHHVEEVAAAALAVPLDMVLPSTGPVEEAPVAFVVLGEDTKGYLLAGVDRTEAGTHHTVEEDNCLVAEVVPHNFQTWNIRLAAAARENRFSQRVHRHRSLLATTDLCR